MGNIKIANIWFSLLGRGPLKCRDEIISSYGSIMNAYNSNSYKDFEGEAFINKLRDQSLKDKACRIYELCLEKEIKVTYIGRDDYPILLREIYDPPHVLYYYGSLPDKDKLLISVVGSRKSSAYGRQASYSLSKKLGECGIGIVSGLAKGIDSRAHAGALDAQGYTIAVLGAGPDNIYPKENECLYYRIKENGLILSEYPPLTMPLKHHFPARNRIISGLSKGTLVCEAGLKSGAMITVNFAISEGREVFALPGNIDSIYSIGCNLLIKQGASIILDENDILEALNC